LKRRPLKEMMQLKIQMMLRKEKQKHVLDAGLTSPKSLLMERNLNFTNHS